MDQPPDRDREAPEKRKYEKPAIIHSEVPRSRAVSCAGSNEQCAPGPITSF